MKTNHSCWFGDNISGESPTSGYHSCGMQQENRRVRKQNQKKAFAATNQNKPNTPALNKEWQTSLRTKPPTRNCFPIKNGILAVQNTKLSYLLREVVRQHLEGLLLLLPDREFVELGGRCHDVQQAPVAQEVPPFDTKSSQGTKQQKQCKQSGWRSNQAAT